MSSPHLRPDDARVDAVCRTQAHERGAPARRRGPRSSLAGGTWAPRATPLRAADAGGERRGPRCAASVPMQTSELCPGSGRSASAPRPVTEPSPRTGGTRPDALRATLLRGDATRITATSRSSSPSTARYCATVQASVKQIDGTRCPGAGRRDRRLPRARSLTLRRIHQATRPRRSRGLPESSGADVGTAARPTCADMSLPVPRPMARCPPARGARRRSILSGLARG